MSRRIQIVLPDPIAELLAQHAATEGTPPSTLAARLVREQLQDQHASAARRLPSATTRTASQRPSWLEPYRDRDSWRAEMWGAIVALHARYPRPLAAVKDGWWNDDAHLETLAALAVWRAQLDNAGQDPREELSFQARLADYAQQLKSEGGGVQAAWQPGAPPIQWTR